MSPHLEVFRPRLRIEGDPRRNQQHMLVLDADEPFEVVAVDYAVEGRVAARQRIETELHIEQRLNLFQETLRALTRDNPVLKHWPVELAIRLRRIGPGAVAKYSCRLQQSGKRGILQLSLL